MLGVWWFMGCFSNTDIGYWLVLRICYKDNSLLIPHQILLDFICFDLSYSMIVLTKVDLLRPS